MADKKPLDPNKTVCVCKKDGKVVGRIKATNPNASTYIQNLSKQYNGVEVAYEDDTIDILGPIFRFGGR